MGQRTIGELKSSILCCKDTKRLRRRLSSVGGFYRWETAVGAVSSTENLGQTLYFRGVLIFPSPSSRRRARKTKKERRERGTKVLRLVGEGETWGWRPASCWLNLNRIRVLTFSVSRRSLVRCSFWGVREEGGSKAMADRAEDGRGGGCIRGE